VRTGLSSDDDPLRWRSPVRPVDLVDFHQFFASSPYCYISARSA